MRFVDVGGRAGVVFGRVCAVFSPLALLVGPPSEVSCERYTGPPVIHILLRVVFKLQSVVESLLGLELVMLWLTVVVVVAVFRVSKGCRRNAPASGRWSKRRAKATTTTSFKCSASLLNSLHTLYGTERNEV